MACLNRLGKCKKCDKDIAILYGYGIRTHEAGHLETCLDFDDGKIKIVEKKSWWRKIFCT